MSKYFTAWDNFAVDTIGTDVAGWTERGSTGPNSQAPAYGTPCFKKRYLALKSSSSATPMRSALSWDAIDADANRDDVDMVSAFSYDAATVDQLWLYARGVGGSATAPDECYMGIVDKSTGTNNLIIARRNAATTITNIATASLTLASGKNYFIRFRVNGTALKLRVWDAALGRAGEPSTWNLETTDATYSAAGWVGLGMDNAGVADQVAPFNFFAVGTNGDSAVCPRTNAEYTAWLASQEALRVILAKMCFTGYDSSGSPYTATRKAYVSTHGYTSHEQDTPARQHFDNYISAVPTFSREMPAALSGQAVVNFGEMRLRNPAREIDGAAYLLLDGSSGCNATTPDAAALDITGDIDIRADVAADDWTPAAVSMIVAKWQAGGNLAYRLYLGTAGTLNLHWTADGTTILAAVSSVATGFTDGSRHWVRATLDVNDGGGNRVIRFYTSEDGVTWTQLGSTTTTAGTTSIFSGTSKLEIGSSVNGTAERLAGKVYRAQVYSGIAGTLVADFNLANVIKGATSFSTPTGEVWTVNGTAKIRQAAGTAPGQLDDWLRVHWIRDGFEMQMGAPDWPLHDFRHIVRGRLGLPTAPRPDEMVFRIADMSDFFNARVSTTRFSSGIFTNKYKPKLFGNLRCLEIQVDMSLVGTINDAAIASDLNDGTYRLFDATSDAFVHIGGTQNVAITAVDTGTDVMTTGSAHNFSAGYRIQVMTGVAPGGMSTNTNYWVLAAGLTATDFKVTDTFGSTTPVNLTSAGSGGRRVNSFGYTFDVSAGTVTLINPPAGRLFMFQPGGATFTYVSDVIEDIAAAASLSLNHKDSAAFTAALVVDAADSAQCGIATQVGELAAANDLLAKVADGACAWYGFTFDGLLQTGARSLPVATSVQTFDRSNVKANSLRMVDRLRPIDFTRSDITISPWTLLGPPPQVPGISLTTGDDYGETSDELFSGKTLYTPVSYGAAGTPVDDHPDYGDAATTEVIEMITAGGGADARVVQFRKHALGIYEFDTTLPAAELNIGDTITLDFPRLGWKTYSSADPASPDNTATIDATKAVVIGLNINYSAPGPFKVRVKCFRRQPGYYPTANLN